MVSIEELLTKPLIDAYTYKSLGLSVQESLGDVISRIRENIIIKRALTLLPTDPSHEVIAEYVHGRIGIESAPGNIQLGRSVAVISLQFKPTTEPASPETLSELQSAGRRLGMHVVSIHTNITLHIYPYTHITCKYILL